MEKYPMNQIINDFLSHISNALQILILFLPYIAGLCAMYFIAKLLVAAIDYLVSRIIGKNIND